MFQSFTTYKNPLSKPLLFAAVLGVVVLAAFSPVFSQSAEAQQFVCREIDNLAGGVEYNCSANGSFFATSNCDGICTSGGGITRACVTVPADIECGDTISLSGAFSDKEGNDKGISIGNIAMDAILSALIWILVFINNMLRLLAGLVARLLDAAIVISLAGLSGIDAITIGWTITRDIANIFFIFILLIIAIATILRLESYGAKQLLPKLIIVALLINFSLVIAFTVVDASNVLALTFISRITPVSDKLAAILQINKITDTRPITPSAEDIDWQTVTSIGYPAAIGKLNQEFTTDKEVTNATPVLQNEPSEKVIQFFWQATILVLQLTLIFVFVALSVMLLVRSVALIVIFVLAPLGFLAAILPSTRGYAKQWWDKLFQWSFFFPASAFMIYLAIAYGAQMSQYLQGSPVVNMGMLFNYFATVAILIGSLIVAKQMGIGAAAAAVGIGLGIAKRARGYAGKVGRGGFAMAGRPIQQGTAAASSAFLGSKAAQRLANVPLARQMLRIPAAIAQQQQVITKNEAKRIANLSPKQQATMLKTLSANAQVEAFDSMNEKRQIQVVQEMKPEDQMKFSDITNRFDPKLGKDVAKATGNIHQAMRMLHSEYRDKELKDIPDNDVKYQEHVNDYLGDLSNEQMRKLDAKSIGENKFFGKYFATNARNFNDITNSREQIEASRAMLLNTAEDFGVNMAQSLNGIANEFADKLEAKGNEPLAKQMRGSIGINLVIDPSLVGIRSRRGNINVGAPAGGVTP